MEPSTQLKDDLKKAINQMLNQVHPDPSATRPGIDSQHSARGGVPTESSQESSESPRDVAKKRYGILKKLTSKKPGTFPEGNEVRQNEAAATQSKKNIQDEVQKSDLKALVILQQRLGNVLTDMDDLDGESSSNYASRISCIPVRSSKYRLNDAEKKKKVLEDLERKAKYLNREPEREREGEGKGKELVDESEENKVLVGREKEKEEIVDQLILLTRNRDERSHIPVITIAGLSGIGKNKLCRHVYEDKEVQNRVGFQALAPVTLNESTFKSEDIAKQIIKSVVPVATTVSDKKIINILVILDCWRVEIEDRDLKALEEEVKNHWGVEIEHMDGEAVPRIMAIMITTRSCFVVKKIRDSPVKSYDLAGLNEKESAALLEKVLGPCAGDNVSTKKIVRQCRGVPLAITTMAKWVHNRRSQELTPEEQLICSYYDDGFPHVCFAYFSLFPQDFLFDAERLFHLWMAEGLFSSEPEKTGRKCLRDLVRRSMFQDVKKDEFGEVRSFKLHPLMHDIARFVADRNNITMDPSGSKVHSKIQRVSFDLSLDFSRGIPPCLFDKEKPLKSIFFFVNTQSRLPMQLNLSTPVLENIFKSFKKLSVLDLRNLEIVVVPNSIGDLQDLVYLDLSQNKMEKLPNSITNLSKLQTLKLARCYSLEELPEGFENLTQLKHLDMEGCRIGLTSVPQEKLTSLQTLSAIVAETKYFNGPKLDGLELAESNNLLTQLQIRDAMSSEERHLTLTRHLDPKPGVGDEKKKKGSQVAQERVKFHSALGVLILVGTESGQVPVSSTSTATSEQSLNSQVKASFLTSIIFKDLVKLSLQDHSQCKYLSNTDKLPKLKILELIRLDNLKYVEKQCEKDADFYKTLEELKISGCPKLESWWENKEVEVNDRPVFHCISKLHVRDCPNLTCMPLYPLLKDSTSRSFNKEMVLEGSSLKLLLDKPVVGSAQDCNIPLEYLQIQKCNHLENLCSAFQQLSSLQRLTIEDCAKANICGPGNQWKGLESLRFLTLRGIPTLSSLSFGNSVTTLRELTIHRCQKLTSIDSIGKLTSLRKLEISECNQLKSLPKEMINLRSLKTLIILECKLLLPRCQPDTGDDWPQIRHITNKQVK